VKQKSIRSANRCHFFARAEKSNQKLRFLKAASFAFRGSGTLRLNLLSMLADGEKIPL